MPAVFSLPDALLSQLTVVWIALPFVAAFSIYLLPRFDRLFAGAIATASGLYALLLLLGHSSIQLGLLDRFGVTLQIDELTAFFVLTNALVTTAVLMYCWRQQKGSFFYTQVIALHGSVNSVFICADFISVYVALEVISVAAFLLITYPRSDRTMWIGLRYLFLSNTAMLFYLLGAVLVYQANRSFAFEGLTQAPVEALALITLGLLAKGGLFVSGLWLPLTHAESETPVSALLSGVVVKTGVFPLVRCAQLLPSLEPLLALLGLGSALLGVSYAILEKDTKRTLAASTISQLGFVVASPAAAGGYALSHGLAKSALFLLAGNLPSRQFEVLRRTPLPLRTWLPLAIAGLSIAGCPLLMGFGAKAATIKAVEGWPALGLNLAAVGTAAVFTKFWVVPIAQRSGSKTAPLEAGAQPQKKRGLYWAVALLLGGLLLFNGLFLEFYRPQDIAKALLILGLGSGLSVLTLQKLRLQMMRSLEQFEHLVGAMSLMLVLLFWLAVANRI